MIIVTSGTFNFLLSAEGACMSANDDSNLPEVEKIPLVIDAEFTEEEEIRSQTSSLHEISSQKTNGLPKCDRKVSISILLKKPNLFKKSF